MKTPERNVKRVLVVEDEPAIGDVCRRVLSGEGFDVDIAVNGKVAQDMIEKKQYDLCLIDIRMPEMDGYTACREIKMDKATKAIPVVMLTSLDYELNKALGKDVDAAEYITKPVDRQELLDVISRFLPTS